MQDEHHDLIHDFPEYRERIHTLKTADHHFRRLFDEYHHVDREVRRAEYDVEPKCDETVNELKLRRLTLKDNLLSILKAAQPCHPIDPAILRSKTPRGGDRLFETLAWAMSLAGSKEPRWPTKNNVGSAFDNGPL